MATSPGGNWKHNSAKPNAGSPAPNAPVGGTSRRSWMPGGATAKPVSNEGRGRGKRFILAGVLTSGVVGLILLLIWLLSPQKPVELVLVAPEAPDSLAQPENLASVNGVQALAEWAKGRGDRAKLAGAPSEMNQNGWTTKLNPDSKSLIVVFAAPGGADANGPYLWQIPPEARSPEESHKLAVKAILDRLQSHPASQPKLLVFDVAQVPTSLAHGNLQNDFARGLKTLNAAIEAVPGLAVVCSADLHERSWVAEEFRQSVFLHYWLLGLKGAIGQPGQRISGGDLFDYASQEVNRWAVANRDETQKPFVLPAETGRDRLNKLEPSDVPASGFKAPEAPEPIPQWSKELETAWQEAEKLAGVSLQGATPDTLDPVKWREYLNLLLLWERQVRLGQKADGLARRVPALATELRSPPATEPLAISAALPVGRALGLPATERTAENFRRLWSPPEGSTRGNEWEALLKIDRNRETQLRQDAAVFVLSQVLREGPTPAILKQADDVLVAVDGLRISPIETYFLRMLQRNLHATRRPDPALLREALELNILAERTAWFGEADKTPSAEPARYPHAEQVYSWIRSRVEAADRQRELGQDLLFDSNPESWQNAAQFFQTARGGYQAAAKDAQVIAQGIQVRDRILARLPFYAQWLADYRGKQAPPTIAALLKTAEKAAGHAHKLNQQLQGDPSQENAAARILDMKSHADQATTAFEEIVRAFEAELAAFTNTVHPSNWHALDGALRVPFIPAKRRAELYGYLRSISHQLATKSEQQPGTSMNAPAVLARGRAHGQMALALLGGGDELAGVAGQLNEQNPNAQWDALRDAGQKIGQRYRALAAEAQREMDRANGTPLPVALSHLTTASQLARLAHASAPLRVGESPVTAEQRHRRHNLLLWQAERTTRTGWADLAGLAMTPREEWYATKTAALFVRSAETLILNGVSNLPPEESDRLLSASRQQAKRLPNLLQVSVPPVRSLADEPQWTFSVTVSAEKNASIGYPVLWLTPPGPPFTPAPPAEESRKLLRELAEAQSLARSSTNFSTGSAKDNPTGKLETTVLYRGHRYGQTTLLQMAGAPSLEWVHIPPQGPAAFTVLADENLVNGAVTLLIDFSGSMLEPLKGEQSKLQVLHDALEKVLAELPKKTVLTIALFWGETDTVKVETVKGATQILWNGDIGQFQDVMKAVKSLKPNAGNNTPLAFGVRRVLSKEESNRFWPEKSSGIRTLSVLTDGLDNHSGEKAGKVIQEALLASPEDISFNLLFFALPGKEKQDIAKQYAILQDADPFREKNRTPPTLWSDDVSKAEDLANRLQQAMLPRVLYRKEETAKGSRNTEVLRVTLPREQLYQPSLGVNAGVFNLYGVRAAQKIQLDPGDRILFRTKTREGGFDLTIPPHAYDMAGKLGRPRASATTGTKTGVNMTVPELRFTDRTDWCDLTQLVTLEPVGQLEDAPLLKAPRPLFAWFDLLHQEGGPLAGITPRIRIENRPGLLAPTWSASVQRWDRNAVNARMPEINATWVESKPGSAARFPITTLNDLDREFEKLPKTATLAGSTIAIHGMSLDDIPSAGTMPGGKYLTVRLNYGTPGKHVFLRPGALKGPRQPFLLAERHLYYDELSQYTARFGPLTPEDLQAGVELELYSVAELREAAKKTGRHVSLRVENTPQNRSLSLPDELKLAPAGK